MIIPPFGQRPKLMPHKVLGGAAYSDVRRACKQNAAMQAVRQLLET
jgi:hypothetical protein